MNWPTLFHAISLIAAYTVVVFSCLVCLCLFWCWLRNSRKARKQAREAARATGAIYLSFVVRDRLTEPTEAEKAILEARAGRRRKIDEDIEAITRQIEENR